MTDNISLADIAAVTKGDDGMFGGNSWAWIIIILLFLGGGYGFGGNRANAATTEDLAAGFANNTVLSNQREITNGLFGLQNTLNQGFSGLNTAVLNSACGVERAIDSCCCNTNRNIDSLRYEMSKGFCDVITNANNNTAAIIGYYKDDKIHDLELKNQTLAFQLSQNAQSQTIIDALKTTTTA